MSKRGVYTIVSGPSGAGKDHVVEELLRRFPDAAKLITTTTRPPRATEVDGVHYHFVDEQRFKEMERAGEFLETDRHYLYWYGSSRATLAEMLSRHALVISIINPDGVLKIKRTMPECIAFFIVPTPVEAVRRRIAERQTGDPAADAERLAAFDGEMALSDRFDYRIENREGSPLEAIDVIERALRERHLLASR